MEARGEADANYLNPYYQTVWQKRGKANARSLHQKAITKMKSQKAGNYSGRNAERRILCIS